MSPKTSKQAADGPKPAHLLTPVTALVMCLFLVTALAEHSDDYLATYDLKFSPADLGLINALGACAFLVGVPVAWAVNRWGRSRVLLVLVSAVGIVGAANYGAWSKNSLGLAGLLVGAGACALLQVAMTVSVDSWWPSLVGHERAEQLFARSRFVESLLSVGLPLGVGGLLAVAPAGVLLTGVTATAGLAALCLLGLQVVLWLRRPTLVNPHVVSAPGFGSWAGLKLLFTNRVLVWSLVASTLLNGSYAFLFGFYFMGLARFADLSPWWVGFALACQSGADLAATGWAGWSRRPVTAGSRFGASVGLLGMAAVFCVVSTLVSAISVRQVLLVSALALFAAGQTLVVVAIYGMTVPLIPEEVRVTVQGARTSVVMSLVPMALLAGAWIAQTGGFATALQCWGGLLMLSIGAVLTAARISSHT